MGIRITRGAAKITVRIDGAASVRIVSETRTALLEALGSGRTAEVDLSTATTVDAAFYQLLVSATTGPDGASAGIRLNDPQSLTRNTFAND